MASAIKAAQIEILQALAAAWDEDMTPVAWPNVGFKAPDGSWLRLDILWGDGFVFTMGPTFTGANQIVGVIQGTVFMRKGEAEAELMGLIDDFRDVFSRKTLTTVRCEAPSGPVAVQDDEWNAAMVRIPFSLYETV